MAGTDSSKSIHFQRPIIILKNIQLEENLGMVMKTMLNFGFKNLRLIKPKFDLNGDKVKSSSAGAFDIIKKTLKVYQNLEKSIEDVEFLCATSVRKRDLDSFVDFPRNTIKNLKNNYKKNTIAFLFGPEKSGLKNKDLSYSNIVINIPTVGGFGSLNLAMSVNIICYEWYLNSTHSDSPYHYNKEDLANKKEINGFNKRLLTILKENSFFSKSDNSDKLIANLRNIFHKNNLTNKELRILHGVITSIKKRRN